MDKCDKRQESLSQDEKWEKMNLDFGEGHCITRHNVTHLLMTAGHIKDKEKKRKSQRQKSILFRRCTSRFPRSKG